MNFDLHSHTLCSDGALSPDELIARAVDRGVDALAITDHDTLDAYCDLEVPEDRIRLITGIELSTQWNATGIHVIGLNIDIQSEAMLQAVRRQTEARLQRARKIGERLESKGIEGAFAGARELSANHYIGRPHFARFLVESGRVDSIDKAFKKYMGDGKAGDVRQHWAGLGQVVDWIREAGGIPVLAHPLKYKLTRTRLKLLLADFIEAGGLGMEVVSGKQLPAQINDMARLCEQFGLLASRGSDFHRPDTPWAELGAISPLPRNVRPVWELF